MTTKQQVNYSQRHNKKQIWIKPFYDKEWDFKDWSVEKASSDERCSESCLPVWERCVLFVFIGFS